MSSGYGLCGSTEKTRLTNRYQDTSLFPLRDTIFEGVPVKIPYRYADLLEEEYGEQSLTLTDYNE